MTRALVLGGGLAGLCAAAALRHFVDEVVVFERDLLGASPGPRRGVPQASQLHNLLSAAQVSMEELLPGFLAALRRAGAVSARVSSDTYVYELGIRMPERDLGFALMCARRPIIEKVARDLLIDSGGIEVHAGASAVDVSVADGRVHGAVIRRMGSPDLEDVKADLVVDAMGTSSNARHWLEKAGHQVPEDVRRVEQWYSSAIYRRPVSLRGSRRFWLVFPTPPRSRGGLVSPVDEDYFHVSLSGREQDTPPRSHAEYMRYASSLEDPVIGALLSECQPVTAPGLFRKTHATWWHYERAKPPVVGFIPIGDAFASLNPLFGQGMSVAAMQGVVLARHLGVDRDLPHGLASLTSRYLHSGAEIVRGAWELGTLIDGTVGWQHSLADPRQGEALGKLLFDNPDVHRTYVRIWHLLEPTTALAVPMVNGG